MRGRVWALEGGNCQLKRLLNSGQPPTNRALGDWRWEEVGVSGMVQGAVVALGEEPGETLNRPFFDARTVLS